MTDDGTTQVHVANPAAEEYLAGVRAALADLPAPEVGEILDEVRAHLADLTAELGGSADLAALTARLGLPSEYAAELRAAAGYAPAAPDAGSPGHALARLAVAALVAATVLVVLGFVAREPVILLLAFLAGALGLLLVGREGSAVPSVAALPEVRRFADGLPAAGASPGTVAGFVASLQPAWWVIRAIVAAVLVVEVFVGGDLPAVLLVALVAVPVSVWVGYRSKRDRRWLWAVVPLNTLAAVLLPAGILLSSPSPVPESYPSAYQMGLWQDSERQIRDIRPVDAAGNPLTGVYLFDQDGMPIDTSGGYECSEADGDADPDSTSAYPRGTWEYNPRTGRCRHVPPGPLVVAVPTTSAPGAGSATAVPTPGPAVESVPPAPSTPPSLVTPPGTAPTR
jgi:uncharacterized membrane protein